jgi:hypothetical protein
MKEEARARIRINKLLEEAGYLLLLLNQYRINGLYIFIQHNVNGLFRKRIKSFEDTITPTRNPAPDRCPHRA